MSKSERNTAKGMLTKGLEPSGLGPNIATNPRMTMILMTGFEDYNLPNKESTDAVSILN